MRFLLVLLSFILIAVAQATAQDDARVVERDSLKYIVILKSGDRFRGKVVGYSDSTISLLTQFGVVSIRKDLVKEFVLYKGPYGRPPHHFIMPTASASGPGLFLSNYELGFFYAGFGLGNSATITAGFSAVPGFSLSSQLYHAGAKFTLEQNERMELAVGATYTFLTTREPYAHLYGVVTSEIGNGRWSAMLFYKVSGGERAPIELYGPGNDTTRFTLFYEGAMGVALGIDGPLFGRDDLSFFGEIWNNDVTKPQNTMSVIGLRVFNEKVSADFGIALIPSPIVAPATRFTWRF